MRSVDFLPDPLGLQRGEEALHRRILPDVAGPAHRTNDAIVGPQALELLARILGFPCRSDAARRPATRAVAELRAGRV